MKGFLLAVALLAVGSLAAQTITIKKVEVSGDKIIVYYDLEESNPDREFLLNMFASRDNFTAPLQKVKGDIGPEVKPGLNKKVEWSIREEYGGYKGKLSLEIRGKIYVPFVKLQNFDAAKSYKRGKQYDIMWRPGNTDPIHIELYKGNQRVAGDLNQPNNGSYTLSIPSGAKTGSDYRLKITDSKSAEDVIYTSYFKVKPKVPLLLKVLPVLVIGGAAAVLGGGGGGAKGGSSSGTGTGTSGGDIVTPPIPPG